MTLHKDDSLFAMKEGKKDGIVIINEGNSQEGLFRQTVKWDETQDWEVEFCGTEDEEWIKSKTNAFIEFVMSSTDEEFKNNLSKYADVNALIDYIIALICFQQAASVREYRIGKGSGDQVHHIQKIDVDIRRDIAGDQLRQKEKRRY